MRLLFVGNDGGERVRVKSLIKDLISKVAIDGVASMQELLHDKEASLADYQLTFISMKVGDEVVSSVIEQSKLISPEFVKRIILIVPPSKQDGATLKEWLERGVGGFLFEPLSPAQISELIGRVAQNVVEQRTVDIGAVSVKTDVFEAVDLVDRLYRAELAGKKSAVDSKRVSYLQPNLESHFKTSTEQYVDALIELFGNSKPLVVRNAKSRKKQAKIIEAVHPGLDLTKLLIKRHIDPKRASGLLGITEVELKELCGGRMDVTEELADRLARGFGGTKEVWLERQNKYSEWRASLKGPEEKPSSSE